MKIPGTTTTTSAEETLLGIYLNDHLATMTVGVELAGRAARGRQDAGAARTLAGLAAELTEDRSALLRTMQSLDVPVRQYKVIAARVAELVGRLKPNGHVLHRSPLSDVVEVEGLRAVIETNAACWRTLRELAKDESRLDADRLAALLDRAGRHAETLDRCRADAAAAAFATGAGGAAASPAPAVVEDAGAEDAEDSGTEDSGTELPEPPSHDDLPLPDYDHLPKGSLPSRIKSLNSAEVEQLLSYERAHAHRLPVVLILERRLKALAGGAEPTTGSVTALRPEAPLTGS